MKIFFLLSVLIVSLSGCATHGHNLSATPDMGMAPSPLTQKKPLIEAPSNSVIENNASLWRTTPNSLLGLRRAREEGDILTVIVEMNDQAKLQSSLSHSRSTTENMNVNALLGLPEWANGVLPGGATLSPAIDLDRASDVNGAGAISRSEKITFKLAATVVGVQPNGNLIIQGVQQTRVSNETRLLNVTGVIRQQDITRFNTITYDKIANASLSYLSNGEFSDKNKMKSGTRLLNRVLPF